MSEIIKLVAAAYLILVIGVALFQRTLIYAPSRYPAELLPRSFGGLNVEILAISTEDGETLEAVWFEPSADSSAADSSITHFSDPDFPVILFCHGNAGDLRTRCPESAQWASRGIGVMLFDYRGYGASTGSPSENGLYRDAEAAYDFLTKEKGVSPKRIVVFGRSLGGGVASHIAATRDCAGLILESTFTSLLDRAREDYFWMPLGILLQDKFSTVERIPKIEAPVLIVHGEKDELMNIRHGKMLAEKFGKQAETYWIPEADHNQLVSIAGPAYFQTLESFIRKRMSENACLGIEK